MPLVWAFTALVVAASVTVPVYGPPELTAVAGFVVLAGVAVFLSRGMLYAQQRLSGVRVTPEQFPEAHAMLVEAAAAYGLRRVPEAFVVLGNGVLNAFASGHGHRRFVVFNSDLFEVGGRLRDPEAFRFVLGHEVGHIAAGHTSYLRMLLSSVSSVLPVAGATLSRAQEYTADNHGYSLTPDGSRGLTVLAAGRYLYPQVDFDAMADRAAVERGFFAFVANALSTHPVLVKRFAALRDRSRPGRLFR
ncbi:M48 family metallopeptidase [Kitasatospora phosalacinea]|uniref:M48 family metallopeptidase n=1 Tax=Kitasatospora phosalacinea TaxID=2065 RepID=A0ABW6GUV0_9ACTN